MIKALLADEDKTLCRNLSIAFKDISDIELIHYFFDRKQVFSEIFHYRPDVLVMDFMKPVPFGCDLVESLYAEFPEIKILIVSDIGKDSFVSKLCSCNVDYYLMKPFCYSVLACRIRQVEGINKRQYAFHQPYDQQIINDQLVKYFNKLGIPPHFKGYRYLIDAIALVALDSSWLKGITKRLYPIVGASYDTTSSQVERSIRNAIEVAWERGDINSLYQFFPYTVNADRGKPTNASFIAHMADIVNYNLQT